MFMTSGVLADYWKKLFDDGLFGFGVSYEVFYREDFQVKKETQWFDNNNKIIDGPYLVVDFLKSYKEKQKAECCNNVIHSSEWRRNYVYCLPSEVRVVLSRHALYQREKPRHYTDYAYGWSNEPDGTHRNDRFEVRGGKRGKFLKDLCDRYGEGFSYVFWVWDKEGTKKNVSMTEWMSE